MYYGMMSKSFLRVIMCTPPRSRNISLRFFSPILKVGAVFSLRRRLNNKRFHCPVSRQRLEHNSESDVSRESTKRGTFTTVLQKRIVVRRCFKLESSCHHCLVFFPAPFAALTTSRAWPSSRRTCSSSIPNRTSVCSALRRRDGQTHSLVRVNMHR